MALSLQEILGFVPLTKHIETVKNGVPPLLPPAFYQRKPEFRVLGDRTSRIETAGTRKNARVVPYGAPGQQIEHLPLDGRPIQLMHTEEKLQFSHELFMLLREFESYTVMQRAAKEAQRQALNAATRQDNLLKSATHVLLATGGIHFDSDNFLLPSSSGASFTISAGVPANNLNQANGAIDASWALSTTNIPGHLKTLRQRARQTTGYPLKYALYGKNIMSHMLRNEFVKNYLVSLGGADRAKTFLDSGEMPSKMFDFEWIPMNETFFDTEAGTTTEIWGDDTLVLTPDPADPNVYGIYEGSMPVPTEFSITGDMMAQWKNFTDAYGAYGYGYSCGPWNGQTLGLFGVYGDTFLPSLMTPGAYYILDTTP
jgi:hypothetical protein